MSRTKRKIHYHYKSESDDILNNELIYPFDLYHYHFSTRSTARKKVDNRNKKTNWDAFFKLDYYHGYDGCGSAPVGSPTSKLPWGHHKGWHWGKKRECRRFFKQKASKAARLWAKKDILRTLYETI